MNKAELGTSPLTPGFSGWAVRGNETLPSYAFPSLLPPAFASTLMALQCMMLPTLEIVPKGQFQLKNSACYLDHPLIQSWDLVQAAQLCWPRWVHFALHSGTGSSRSAQAVVVLHSSTRSLPAGGCLPGRASGNKPISSYTCGEDSKLYLLTPLKKRHQQTKREVNRIMRKCSAAKGVGGVQLVYLTIPKQMSLINFRSSL